MAETLLKENVGFYLQRIMGNEAIKWHPSQNYINFPSNKLAAAVQTDKGNVNRNVILWIL